ncbi:MAG: hypothetical protein H0V18_14720 [Pyrinomonadaceae bacterium]|nr:hypothetical protein [Pyrinomonadaceae bacterium]
MPSVIKPMQPTLHKYPFSDPTWIFEPKWDGYRAICFLSARKVRFVSRNQKSLTERFPELQGITESIKAEAAILDGEIVALDQAGMPCFNALRSRKVPGCKIVFYAFDLLHLDGQDLTQSPLLSRKKLLKKVISKRSTSRLRYTDHIVGEGEYLFAELERQHIEGMVAKKADSLYVGGRTRSWLKIKTSSGKEEMRVRIETWHGEPK